MPDSQPLPFSTRAEALFCDFIERVDAGEQLEFEGLCRAHPDIESELRALKRAFDAVERIRPSRTRGPSVAQRIRAKYGEGIDPTVTLDAHPKSDSGLSSKLFEKLRAEGPRGSRYKLLGEVARGGMGAILKVWDDELRRSLAMKVVLGKGDDATGDTPSIDPKSLGRFLEEAQITGQLDHPGIVPVHELGLDATGRVYFTMRLVKGEDLRTIFEHVKSGHDGWNQVRALNVLLRVCEAMAFAHSKGVVHRDLKPANVMVGKFGEVYVMDWGLARVIGRDDKHDLRIKPQSTSSASVVRTERREDGAGTHDSPLITMDGDVVGTPSFMPPEQARGELDKLGPHSDVYSIGAMLYQLVTGEMPYVPAGVRVSQYMILDAVLRRAPEPIESIAKATPPELVAICEKAMARDIARRFADTVALASELRAYLEGRVVPAYETGTWAESKKWVARNRLTAALGLAAFLGLAAAVVVSKVQRNRAVVGMVREREKTAELEQEARDKFVYMTAYGVEQCLKRYPDDSSINLATTTELEELFGAMLRYVALTPRLESAFDSVTARGAPMPHRDDARYAALVDHIAKHGSGDVVPGEQVANPTELVAHVTSLLTERRQLERSMRVEREYSLAHDTRAAALHAVIRNSLRTVQHWVDPSPSTLSLVRLAHKLGMYVPTDGEEATSASMWLDKTLAPIMAPSRWTDRLEVLNHVEIVSESTSSTMTPAVAADLQQLPGLLELVIESAHPATLNIGGQPVGHTPVTLSLAQLMEHADLTLLPLTLDFAAMRGLSVATSGATRSGTAGGKPDEYWACAYSSDGTKGDSTLLLRFWSTSGGVTTPIGLGLNMGIESESREAIGRVDGEIVGANPKTLRIRVLFSAD